MPADRKEQLPLNLDGEPDHDSSRRLATTRQAANAPDYLRNAWCPRAGSNLRHPLWEVQAGDFATAGLTCDDTELVWRMFGLVASWWSRLCVV